MNGNSRNGSLPNPWLSDEDGVVFRAPTEDPDDTADFVVAPNDGIQLSFLRQGCEINGILGQSVESLLRTLAFDSAVSA